MKHKLLIGLLILVISISSCSNLPSSKDSSDQANAPRAWFDAPLPGTVFYPPNPCMIAAHGTSPNGIALFELSINGTMFSLPCTDTHASLATLSRECGLSDPGEYNLMLRSQDNDGNWSGYAEASLIIAEGETPIDTPLVSPTLAFQGIIMITPTLTPVVTSTPQIVGGVTIEYVSTNLVYLGGSSCGTREVTISARAIAPKRINVVILFYRFQTASSSSAGNILANKVTAALDRNAPKNLADIWGDIR